MRKLLLIGIMAMLTITTACGEETISEAKNEQANVNSVVQKETANGNEAQETNHSTNPSNSDNDEKTIRFSSGSEAIDYLRKQLHMENHEGIIFDDMGGSLEKDSYQKKITLCY